MVSISTRQAPEQLVIESHQARLHGALDRGEHLTTSLQEPRHQVLREVALLPNERGL
jgi:hypothetical protein